MARPSKDQYFNAYRSQTAQIRAAVTRYANASYSALGSYRDRDIDRLVDQILPRVQAGQIKIAALTSAYIAAVDGSSAIGVSASNVLHGRGVDPEEVYRRPAVTMRKALSEGKPYPEAVEQGKGRLLALVAMDMQMSKIRQSRESMAASKFTQYRRVLGGGENCALCVIASTQRYWKEDLLPIHPGCYCDVEPINVDYALPQVIRPELLEDTHGRVEEFAGEADRGGRSPDYKQLIVTEDHGEHGPSLRWRGDKFTGPEDI